MDHFCLDDLKDIQCTRVTKEPKTGKVTSIVIEGHAKKKDSVSRQIDSKIVEKLKSILKSTVSVDSNTAQELAQFLEKKRGDSTVLYIPDIAQSVVTVYSLGNINQAADELKVCNAEILHTVKSLLTEQ